MVITHARSVARASVASSRARASSPPATRHPRSPAQLAANARAQLGGSALGEREGEHALHVHAISVPPPRSSARRARGSCRCPRRPRRRRRARERRSPARCSAVGGGISPAAGAPARGTAPPPGRSRLVLRVVALDPEGLAPGGRSAGSGSTADSARRAGGARSSRRASASRPRWLRSIAPRTCSANASGSQTSLVRRFRFSPASRSSSARAIPRGLRSS